MAADLGSSHSDDLYAVLGVAPDATEGRIREAYRSMARRLHPDRRPGDPEAEERFRRVTAAYEVLADADRRAAYDRARRAGAASSGGPGSGRRRPGAAGPITIPVQRVQDAGGDYLRARPRPRVRRQGGDLAVTVPVTYPEAVLGAEVPVPLPGGERVTVRVPPGTPAGRVLRFRGLGAAGRGRGDLLVTVEIVVPRTVGDAERRAIEALAAVMEVERRDGPQ